MCVVYCGVVRRIYKADFRGGGRRFFANGRGTCKGCSGNFGKGKILSGTTMWERNLFGTIERRKMEILRGKKGVGFLRDTCEFPQGEQNITRSAREKVRDFCKTKGKEVKNQRGGFRR